MCFVKNMKNYATAILKSYKRTHFDSCHENVWLNWRRFKILWSRVADLKFHWKSTKRVFKNLLQWLKIFSDILKNKTSRQFFEINYIGTFDNSVSYLFEMHVKIFIRLGLAFKKYLHSLIAISFCRPFRNFTETWKITL